MLEDLENALAEHAPAGGELASELPPLTIDGIPVSVDKMTQVRLDSMLLICLSIGVQTTPVFVEMDKFKTSSLHQKNNAGVPSRGHN